MGGTTTTIWEGIPWLTTNQRSGKIWSTFHVKIKYLFSAKPPKQENGFSAADIAEMKKRFEQKLAHDFPTRSDGQKTTLELVSAVTDTLLFFILKTNLPSYVYIKLQKRQTKKY